MTDAPPIADKIKELRNAFDRAFAIPAAAQVAEHLEDLLSIRVAGEPYAINISETSGIVNNKKIVALPSSVPAFLGIAGICGGLVPVYSLAALLGYSHETGKVPWLVLGGSEEPVGLAFSDFEGYLQVPLTNVYAAEQTNLEHAPVRQFLRAADTVRGIVSIPYLRDVIERRCGKSRASEER